MNEINIKNEYFILIFFDHFLRIFNFCNNSRIYNEIKFQMRIIKPTHKDYMNFSLLLVPKSKLDFKKFFSVCIYRCY